ncbi:MAG TPA: response regulator transcription factor, partial [Solirubrobacteraceae bacterium]
MAMTEHVRGSILVVDDEPTIGEVLSRYLERAGYRTCVAHDGAAAMVAVAEHDPDLVVLDIMLPRLDGLEVMRRIRERDRDRTAIILLTAKGDESDRVVGLRLGADDYVVKPFSPAELVARVDAVLRRLDISTDLEPPLDFDALRIEPGARRVRVAGEEVALTQR